MNTKPSRPSIASPVDVGTLLNQGRALHAQGRISDAFSRYQAALAAAPNDAEALHLLGVAYLGMGQMQLGLAFVRRAITERPDEADFRLNLATALARHGELDEAATHLQVVCSLRPDDAQALANLAALQVLLERGSEAEGNYAAAIAIDPQHAAWHEALARLRYRRWAMPEATASAQQALQLSSSAAQRLNMGFALPREAPPQPSPTGLLNLRIPLSPADLAQACAERDLVVIDDFLADPLALRAHALQLLQSKATSLERGNFPGMQSPPQPCAATMQHIADALGRGIRWDSPDNGALRVSLASDDARADVHVDNPTLPDIYGGVLYLSLPEDCRGGTRFYRHRATGWERRPDDAVLRAAGYATFLDFQKRKLPANRRLPFSEWLGQRDATWEALFEVPMRFNRLIVFRSDYFHSIAELFGDRPENGRLAQLFHFEG
jgi:Flp pilus assembly protein TadD